MKAITKSTIIIISVLISAQSYSQSAATGRENLSGTWIGSCPPEFQDQASMMNCDLCPSVIDRKNPSMGRVKDIELTFKNDSITLNRNDEITTVAYTMHNPKHTFSFKVEDREHTFRVFYAGEGLVLEDSDGFVMVLERKDAKKTIPVYDLRTCTPKNDTSVAGQEDGGVYIARILTRKSTKASKDTGSAHNAYEIHFFRYFERKFKNYQLTYVGDEDFNYATYYWQTDSSVIVTLLNTGSDKKKKLKLSQTYYKGQSAAIFEDSSTAEDKK